MEGGLDKQDGLGKEGGVDKEGLARGKGLACTALTEVQEKCRGWNRAIPSAHFPRCACTLAPVQCAFGEALANAYLVLTPWPPSPPTLSLLCHHSKRSILMLLLHPCARVVCIWRGPGQRIPVASHGAGPRAGCCESKRVHDALLTPCVHSNTQGLQLTMTMTK